MDPSIDWQTCCHEIKDRGEYLLKTGKWADCHFLVGSEPNQSILPGHKLILAMASPVFDAMFNGGLPEKNDPIQILDVQPEAFKALLEYIYTDKISINSMDKACELCYVAKKYMLPHVVEQCTKFLWSDLSAKNVCRAYEFANLFEEPRLAERCLQIICTQTEEMLTDPSFEDIELPTLLTILDQEYLQISSELDLFLALARYAEKHDYGKPMSKEEEENANAAGPSNQMDAQQPQPQPPTPQPQPSPEVFIADGGDNQQDQQQHQPLQQQEPDDDHNQMHQDQPQPLSFRDAVKKIRFLTLLPKQFAENVARSNILTQAEAFAILMNISSPTHDIYPMPGGFSTSTKSRSYIETPCVQVAPIERGCSNNNSGAGSSGTQNQRVAPFLGFREEDCMQLERGGSGLLLPTREPTPRNIMETRKFYCVRTIRQQIDYFNTSVSDCSLTFTVDRSICITGIQVPTQVMGEQTMHSGIIPERYSELLYAHLLDSQGSRLTYTHCTSRVRYDSLLEISFDRPVFIQRNKVYKIGVAFNKLGWYPMCTCAPLITFENVCFAFNVGPTNESVRDGLIRAIVFTLTRENMYS